MLDSDMQGSDARLAVRFYQKEVINNFKTQMEGRPIYDMRDFVTIEVPGDRNTIIDTFVNEEHKRRFPMHWAQYQNALRENGDMGDVQGTLLKDWSLLNPAQALELKHFKFYTVEQVASASDEQITRLGMVAGISPYSLRDKAKAYLAHAKDSALVQAQADELRKRDDEIAAMKRQIEELSRQNAEDSPKRGRPPKEQPKE